ncbi:hypothetical protein B7R74_20310 [Yersinia pseudotuberculosis]|uniref:Uncharacterized protein n=1 Tax=Yersinia pseudotuberculosis TaxID=633 RepID=A0A380Q881_YERPU|nr:hypothetical protein [Yersinia pseudotuberculosis]PSH12430.1 hypothetical protein B7R74_20310 [Yersinia pseudotuberculosis]SUP82550.1 Uncharacterised protein [Yersinia pseudotuberculosis]
MAVKVKTKENSSLTLKEFILFLETSGNLEKLRNSIYSSEVMSDTASQLRALAASKEHILSIIIKDLENTDHFQPQNYEQTQGFVLHSTPYYTIRLMLWIPPEHQAGTVPLSYNIAHDHTVDLMTVGFFGPGYRTSLYEFDYNEPIQRTDGLTRLDYKGEMYLRENEVIYYFANKDVHIQHEPESLSVSLNLVISKPDTSVRQTIFDIKPIDGDGNLWWGNPRFNSIDKIISQRSIFSALLTHGNMRTKKAIKHIAQNHEADEARALSWVAILHNDNTELNNVLTLEESPYVKRVLAGLNLDQGKSSNISN